MSKDWKDQCYTQVIEWKEKHPSETKDLSIKEIYKAWKRYSKDVAASWLVMSNTAQLERACNLYIEKRKRIIRDKEFNREITYEFAEISVRAPYCVLDIALQIATTANLTCGYCDESFQTDLNKLHHCSSMRVKIRTESGMVLFRTGD